MLVGLGPGRDDGALPLGPGLVDRRGGERRAERLAGLGRRDGATRGGRDRRDGARGAGVGVDTSGEMQVLPIGKAEVRVKGKRIAASFGTINHLYILALIEAAGLTVDDVELVNTPPPDMTVALLAGGIDAFVGWDPWPIVAQKDVPGAYQVIRGGNHISYVGFNVGMRDWIAENGETIEKFLAAVSEADQWMRANPADAAQVAARWIPGLDPAVAEEAMEYNVQQADRRLSANNYAALHAAVERLNRLGFIEETFDVNEHIDATHIVKVMAEQPELFSDLPEIPEDARIGEGYAFQP